jgi:hypothetical protein
VFFAVEQGRKARRIQEITFLFFCCLSAMLNSQFMHSFKGRTKKNGENKNESKG